MSVFVLTTLLVYIIFNLGEKKTVTSKGTITVNTELEIIRDTQTFFFIVGVVIFAYVTGQRFAFGDTYAYMKSFSETTATASDVLNNFQFGEEQLFLLINSFRSGYR